MSFPFRTTAKQILEERKSLASVEQHDHDNNDLDTVSERSENDEDDEDGILRPQERAPPSRKASIRARRTRSASR